MISPHTSRTRAQGSRLRMSCLVGTTRAGPLGRRVESTRRTRSHPRARDGRRRLAPRRGRRRRTRETRAVARADPARVTRRRVVLARRAVRRRRAVTPPPRPRPRICAPRRLLIRGGDERRVRHRRPRARRLRRHASPTTRRRRCRTRWTRLHRVLRLVLPARRRSAATARKSSASRTPCRCASPPPPLRVAVLSTPPALKDVCAIPRDIFAYFPPRPEHSHPPSVHHFASSPDPSFSPFPSSPVTTRRAERGARGARRRAACEGEEAHGAASLCGRGHRVGHRVRSVRAYPADRGRDGWEGGAGELSGAADFHYRAHDCLRPGVPRDVRVRCQPRAARPRRMLGETRADLMMRRRRGGTKRTTGRKRRRNRGRDGRDIERKGGRNAGEERGAVEARAASPDRLDFVDLSQPRSVRISRPSRLCPADPIVSGFAITCESKRGSGGAYRRDAAAATTRVAHAAVACRVGRVCARRVVAARPSRTSARLDRDTRARRARLVRTGRILRETSAPRTTRRWSGPALVSAVASSAISQPYGRVRDARPTDACCDRVCSDPPAPPPVPCPETCVLTRSRFPPHPPPPALGRRASEGYATPSRRTGSRPMSQPDPDVAPHERRPIQRGVSNAQPKHAVNRWSPTTTWTRRKHPAAPGGGAPPRISLTPRAPQRTPSGGSQQLRKGGVRHYRKRQVDRARPKAQPHPKRAVARTRRQYARPSVHRMGQVPCPNQRRVPYLAQRQENFQAAVPLPPEPSR